MITAHHTRWSTASFGDSTDTRPGELNALQDHLKQCAGGGWRTRWQCAGATLHGHSAARFVTTLLLLAAGAVLVGALVAALAF